MSKPTVAVAFGGRSSEHGVSCVTAGGVLGAIDRDKWNVVALGITSDGRWTVASDEPSDWAITDGALPTVANDGETVLLPVSAGSRTWRVEGHDGRVRHLADIDVVFPVLHGPFGEDGTLQGALELLDVRYVGAGVLASAVGMDKQFMKTAFKDAGLPVTPDVVLYPGEHPEGHMADIEALGLPLFVKPARAGSSMGISRVDDLAELDAAVDEAVKHDPKVLIERGVSGREIETAVLATETEVRVSPAGEIVTGGDYDFYDFEAKYLDDGDVRLLCPTTLPAGVADVVADYARRAFRAVGAEGLARVDVFVSEDGTVTVNEINTMPGFTTTSMYPRMWASAGVDYPELVQTLLETALERRIGLR
ncbi:D-alanine--D-alanine ligase family protein [Demequina aurantiaca]|uniref:D-alanine--D-alanine ligase family protein n=1 Tax=Demequina aurantiaca TaxID=676200 RepID=UPI000782CEA9|nr:D-alanine--D-alanine ligase family protein [Demequina aurantiaca]